SSDIGENVIYFGPMGCQTGFYLLVRNADDKKVLSEVKKVLRMITEHKGEMFGASRKECGNYLNLHIDDAKKEAVLYLEALQKNSSLAYPKGEE
ncbi:MAG: S-ribosylhomocysteine lyase, partial [Clostridia bacterium]|nr:S-ribosylhomocysteine lyase [Clostridia bacterium]